jgi:hypothetical protein
MMGTMLTQKNQQKYSLVVFNRKQFARAIQQKICAGG